MKFIGIFIAGFLISMCFLACNPIRYVGIEVYNPASLTFPKGVKRILIVNNAVNQRNVPFESTINRMVDSVKIDADSTTTIFCQTLGVRIAESPYFEDVLLLEKGLRIDSYSYLEEPLTQDQIKLLCTEHEVDAILSLDRLLYKTKEYVQEYYGFEMVTLTDVEVQGTLSVHLPNQKAPLGRVLLSDTITPGSYSNSEELDWAAFLDPSKQKILQEAARMVAIKAYTHFIPYWSEDVRWYYISSDARWKEAAAFASIDKWDQAAEIWKNLYERTNSWNQRARLASNLALCNEIKGAYSDASSYSIISYEVLDEYLDSKNRYVKMQKIYKEVISQRLLSEEKLKKQLNN